VVKFFSSGGFQQKMEKINTGRDGFGDKWPNGLECPPGKEKTFGIKSGGKRILAKSSISSLMERLARKKKKLLKSLSSSGKDSKNAYNWIVGVRRGKISEKGRNRYEKTTLTRIRKGSEDIFIW